MVMPMNGIMLLTTIKNKDGIHNTSHSSHSGSSSSSRCHRRCRHRSITVAPWLRVVVVVVAVVVVVVVVIDIVGLALN